jgi:integrase/DNA-directed RNA polymerase subunit RPC12/RpoP
MAINYRCLQCKSEFKLDKKKCPNCGDSNFTNRRYKVTVRLPDGRWIKRQTKSLGDAKTIEAHFKAATPNALLAGQKAPFIKEVWIEYIAWAEIAKRSWKDDRARYRLNIEQTFGSTRMNAITPQKVRKWLSGVRERTNRYGKPIKIGTVSQIFVLLKRLFNWAYKQGIYEGTNPCNKVTLPKFDNQRTSVLSKAQYAKLREVLAEWPDKATERAILFALYSGRRQGEILSLEWSNVDFDMGVLTFLGAYTKNARTQSIPMNENMRMILLEAWQAQQDDELRKLCFPSAKGAYFSNLSHIWMGIRKQVGLGDFRLHDLRHTYASWLASSGHVDIYTLKELLGHREIKMTQRYAHLINGALRRGASVADDVFS